MCRMLGDIPSDVVVRTSGRLRNFRFRRRRGFARSPRERGSLNAAVRRERTRSTATSRRYDHTRNMKWLVLIA
jgi:hypothetical protein